MARPYKTTVSVAADTIDLTLLATVKTELGLETTESDSYLSSAITQASRSIATYCNRTFARETLVDNFRLDDGDLVAEPLLLSRFPVASISSIVENETTLASDEYEFDADTGQVWRLNGDDDRSIWEPAKIVVPFVAGYLLLDTLPEDIERACIMLVVQNFRAKGRDPTVKATDIPGVMRREYWVGSTGQTGAFPPEVESLLNPYRVFHA
jgi:hypothetical protein